MSAYGLWLHKRKLLLATKALASVQHQCITTGIQYGCVLYGSGYGIIRIMREVSAQFPDDALSANMLKTLRHHIEHYIAQTKDTP